MKFRRSLVSNSSSASFIVHWKYRDFGQEHDLKEILALLFEEENLYDKTTKQYKWENSYLDEGFKNKLTECLEYLEKNTQKNSDGSFLTTFFTAMRNSPLDFSEHAASFLLCLVENGKFQLIDSRTEDDY